MQKRKYFRVLAFVFAAVLTLAALTVLPHAETESAAESATESDYDADTTTALAADTATEEQNTQGINDASGDPDALGETADSQDISEETNTDGDALPNQYIYEDDTIIVTAVLADNTLLPAYAQFCVTPITEEIDSIAYQEVEDKIAENLKDQEKVITGFLAYDICFVADGVEYEPADGTVTVTIQYKNDLLKETVVDTAEEVKLLHLKEADSGVEVEDLTEQTSISTVPETITTSTTTTTSTTDTTSTTTTPEPETTTVNSTVQFVTESFSTFVITGVASGATPSVTVNMKFLTTAGAVDTRVNGTYYLFIKRSDNYRHTLTLNVTSGAATATLNGLYDKNGKKQNNDRGNLYPLTNANYTAILFSYSGSSTITPNGFSWSDSYTTQGYTKYETGSTINETYSVTELSSNVAIANNTGTFTITATEKTVTEFSSSQLQGALAPVLPYGVFTNYLDLVSNMEGNIAALEADLDANFGLSNNNRNNSFTSTVHNFTVNKTYTGATPKTFTFGLYKNAALMDTVTLTLPTATGGTTGSVTFKVNDGADGYTVAELNSNGEPMNIGDENDGYTLTSADSSTTSSSPSLGSTSYIKTINYSKTTPLRNGTTTMKNNLVVGSGYTTTTSGNTISLKKNGSTKMTADKRYASITVENGTFPIDFSATMNDMAALSTSLATAVTSDTVMVRTMTIAELNSKSGNGLTFNTNGKMLLLNIDASSSPNSIYLYANANFKVNGVSCGGYSPQAGNIIVNIYTKSGANYLPYSGTICEIGYVMGTLLIPRANVCCLGQNYNGTIVANNVRNYYCPCCGEYHGEFHGNAVSGITIDTVCNFVNTEIPPANYNLPEAGGRGSYLFYGIGLTLVGTAAMGLFYLRHRSRKRTRPKRDK